MEKAIRLQSHRFLPNQSSTGYSFSTPIAADVCYLRSQENVRERQMRYLIRNRTKAFTTYPLKFRLPRAFSSIKDTMADEANKKKSSSIELESTIKAAEDVKPKKSEILTSQNIPPPPEKPLPGDCCGSGCVRCVWDVYYEELEEYNKLYKSSPDSSRAS